MIKSLPFDNLLHIFSYLSKEDENNLIFVDHFFNSFTWQQRCRKFYFFLPDQEDAKNIYFLFKRIQNLATKEILSDEENLFRIRAITTFQEYNQVYSTAGWPSYFLAELLWNQDRTEAITLLKVAAERQYFHALFKLAKCYRDGVSGFEYSWVNQGESSFNRDQAIKFFTDAIKLNTVFTQVVQKELGLNYLFGKKCIARDMNKAIELLQPLADRSDNLLAYHVGVHYLNLGKSLDALHYLELAVNRMPRNILAAEQLGILYLDGKDDIHINTQQALIYLNLAVELGSKDAIKILKRINNKIKEVEEESDIANDSEQQFKFRCNVS